MASPLSEGGLDREQRHVVSKIISIGKRRGESPRDIITALITGAQESGFRNLKGGDADSEGWRQERRMYYKNPRNLKASINRFYDELKSASGSTVGERAQSVQGSAYPSAYQPHVGEARKLLKEYNQSRPKVGKGGGLQAPKGSFNQNLRGAKTSVILPGKDYSQQRGVAILNYLQNSDQPGAAIQVSQELSALKDIPRKQLTIKSGPKKGKVKPVRTKLPNGQGSSSKLPVSAGAIHVGTEVAKMFGLSVTSTTGGTHVPGSYHYQRRAIDIAGSPKQMREAFNYLRKNVPHSKLTELFYDPAGFYFDNGQKVKGEIGGHSDHVHLAI